MKGVKKMKKALLLITVLAMLLCSFAVSASADETTFPTTMKLFVMENFDNLSGAVTPEWTNGGVLNIEGVDGAMVIKENQNIGVGWTYGKTTKVSVAPASAAGVIGYGFYIENNTDDLLGTQAYWIGNDNFVGLTAGLPYYTVVDGVATERYG